MSPEQKAAFVNSQVACANIEIAAMELQKTLDLKMGMIPWQSSPKDYMAVIDKYHLSADAIKLFFETGKLQ